MALVYTKKVKFPSDRTHFRRCQIRNAGLIWELLPITTSVRWEAGKCACVCCSLIAGDDRRWSKITKEESVLERLIELVSTQEWALAWAEYQRLEEAGPSSARLQLLGSHAAYGLRDLTAAKGLAERALADALQDRLLGQVRFHLGMVLRELGEVEAALAQFDAFFAETITVYPELAIHAGKAHFYRALCHRQVGDLLQSAASYRLALTGLTGWEKSATLQNLAWVYCLMGRADEARAALCKVEVNGDSVLAIHQAIGEAYLHAVEGELGLAVTGCETLLAQVGLGAQELAEIAWIASLTAQRSGNLDKAVEHCNYALTHALDACDARLVADAKGLAQDIETLRRAG